MYMEYIAYSLDVQESISLLRSLKHLDISVDTLDLVMIVYDSMTTLAMLRTQSIMEESNTKIYDITTLEK